MKYGLFLSLLFTVLLISCKNDDDVDVQSVPPRLLAEVSPENDAEIVEFLETHFYNYEEFASPPADFDYKIKIDTIAGANADKAPLANFIKDTTINVSSSQLALSEEENDISHKLYYLIAREGEGVQPTVADSTLLRYEGMLLDGEKFDASTSFLWQELPFFLRGYATGITKLKSGTSDGLVVNGDGTVSYTNSGVGMVIMPSGLGYFSGTGPTGGIPRYANLIFSVEVGRVIVETDSDNDGVPSILEDRNGNGFMFDDNTDSDVEPANGAFADFQDGDDDGDGVSTRNEISDEDGNIILPYPSTGGIADYLNPDVQRTPGNN
ncbi:hypothetical protein FVB32_17545 [Flagellimonas hymeniacidonis]|uniref:peptidylprolyl isomerase n=1 Tax=Flagellimonas hymeniacidonis TaxID=2603628 RepID=A0A5C8V1M3_9FLAO|nr:hypothetical protein [Flagellimonas hymeniacidonis]TXN34329.1 hypothetical protein FVB32_17545 [Flagellimonas hymeniacidonis]